MSRTLVAEVTRFTVRNGGGDAVRGGGLRRTHDWVEKESPSPSADRWVVSERRGSAGPAAGRMRTKERGIELDAESRAVREMEQIALEIERAVETAIVPGHVCDVVLEPVEVRHRQHGVSASDDLERPH